MSRRSLGVLAAVLAVMLVAAAALAFSRGREAAALASWTCADGTTGERVSFCRTLPGPGAEQRPDTVAAQLDAARIALLARVKGITLESVPMTWGDLWVEDRVPPEIRRLIAASLDDDLRRITADFGRQFGTRPKIVTFASAATFEEGLRSLFGYDDATARVLARNNGGALILELRTITINWALLGRERPLTILRHELSHAMLREIAGYAVELPAWFDEGLATAEQATTPGSDLAIENDLYVASALVIGKRVGLAQLTTSEDWLRQSAALQGRTYAVAATAIELLRTRVGFDGVRRIVEASPSAGFAAAFAAVAGMSVDDFARRFPDLVAERAPDSSMVAKPLPGGEVEWTVRGLAPNSRARVTVVGAGGYRLAFEIQIDPYGMYKSVFGATAPPGTYTVRVEGVPVTLTSEIHTGR